LTARYLQIKVKANSSNSRFEQKNGRYIASIKSPPTDGRANAELIELVSGFFNIAKSQVKIKTGRRNKIKLIELTTS